RRFSRGQVGGIAERYAVEPGSLHPGGAGAGHAVSKGEGDPSPPIRHRRGRRAHAGGGRQALRRDARAHSADRGQGAAEASHPVARKEPQALRRKLITGGHEMAPHTPPRPPHSSGPAKPRPRRAAYTGTTPCFFQGRSTFLVAAISSARIKVGRVSRGSITSSIRAAPAAR